MKEFGSVVEILKYAINRELQANVFYNLLTQYLDDVQLKSLCSGFAAEELEHKAQLELELFKLGHTVKDDIPESSVQNNTSRPLDYMLKIAKTLEMDIERIILMAIEKEKQSFRLYIDLAYQTENPEFREVLINLAEEEARHKLSFELEYERLMAKKDEAGF